MKKSILILVMVLFTSQGYAGFFSSLMGSVVANDLSSSASRAYISPARANKINSYLWHMHKTKKYDAVYMYYLKELEKSTDLNHQDTLAMVYYDNNNSQKAAEIYEKNVLPWLRFQKRSKINSFERNYKKFTGIKGKIDYKSILEKQLPLKEDNATIQKLPDLKTLQVKLAELETKNATLESFKLLSLILSGISLLALGLVFVLLRGKKTESITA